MPEHTIAENLTRLQTARTAIAGAITAKGGTVTSGDGFEDFPTDIATIPSGGGGGVPENDVTFYDYDGTVVAAYSKADFIALSAMPANPTHEGLTAQGWNWLLADAKVYVTKYGRLNIGQMYITSDGKTRIKIKLEEGRLSPVLGFGIDGSVDVDWGDGTTHGTMTGSNVLTLVQLQHVYAAAGEYTIALTVTGSLSFLGSSAYAAAILRKAGVTSATAGESKAYQNAMQELYIGSGVTSIGTYAFQTCYSLASVTIPDNVTSIAAAAFYNCCSLASVTIPNGVTSIAAAAFYNCYSLASVTIPDNVTSIAAAAFYNCCSLASVTIPDNVTSIGSQTFQNCHSLAFIKFEGSIPPTAGGSDTFAGIPTDCIIYVPSGSLEDYESETNYPDPDVYTHVEY